MAHDFAKQRAARANRSNRPAHAPWLWLVSGMVIGTLVSFLVYLATLAPPPPQPQAPGAAPAPQAPQAARVEPADGSKKPAAAPETKPQFDFYDILRHSEGGAATAARDARPAPEPVEVPEPPAQAAPPDATAAAPAPTANTASVTPAAPAPAPAPPATAAPAARPPQAPKPAALAMQAGAFSQYADADRRRGEILLLGYDARVETVKLADGQTRYRVSVGPFPDPQALANARRALRDVGIDTF